MDFLLASFTHAVHDTNYFEAHEYLEQWWFPRRKEKSSEVLFVKGLINASVALELHKRGKIDNAKNVWKTYQKYKKLLIEIRSGHKNEYKKIAKELDTLGVSKGIAQ